MNTDPSRDRTVRRAPSSEIAWPNGKAPDAPQVSVGRPAEPITRLRSPASSLRALYVLTLITSIVPLKGSSWVGLATGGGWLAVLGLTTVILVALAVWRVIQVMRDRHRLAAPPVAGVTRALRVAGVVLMVLGVVVFLLHFFIGSSGRWIAPRGSDNGIEFFVVGLALSMFGGFGVAGILLFEFSRLLGFERLAASMEPAE